MSENHSRVLLDIEDGIATVSLNRADKLNAIDMEMFHALNNVSLQLRKQKALRVVIVKGNGEDFCSGLDIKDVLASRSNALKLLWKWLPGQANLAQRVCINWRRLPVPVIMQIEGRCWGGGLQIALGGDFRIASPQSNFSIMENKWGLLPDMGGTLALREIMSVDHAMELAMTARIFDGIEAKELGIITHLSECPDAKASQLAEELKNRSPDSISAIKRFYQQAWHKNDRFMLAKETLSQIKVLAGKNQRIAVIRATKDSEKPWKL